MPMSNDPKIKFSNMNVTDLELIRCNRSSSIILFDKEMECERNGKSNENAMKNPIKKIHVTILIRLHVTILICRFIDWFAGLYIQKFRGKYSSRFTVGYSSELWKEDLLTHDHEKS